MSHATHDQHPKEVLALPGSLRRGSYNRLLLDAAVENSPAQVKVRVWQELRKVPLFNEDLLAAGRHEPPGVQRLRAAIAVSDGLLIATPEYNQSLPGVVKNVIDWLSMGEHKVLDGKPVAVIGITTGPWGTRLAQGVLRHVLTANGSLVLPQPQMYIREAKSRFDDQGRLKDKALPLKLATMLSALADWIETVTPKGTPD